MYGCEKKHLLYFITGKDKHFILETTSQIIKQIFKDWFYLATMHNFKKKIFKHNWYFIYKIDECKISKKNTSFIEVVFRFYS